jgi:hypothetical protein
MLRPEEREDGELEVIRLPLQQHEDSVVLPVGEAELAVKWLFRDEAQKVILAAASAAGTSHRAAPLRLASTRP